MLSPDSDASVPFGLTAHNTDLDVLFKKKLNSIANIQIQEHKITEHPYPFYFVRDHLAQMR